MDLQQALSTMAGEWPYKNAAMTDAMNVITDASEKEIAKPPITNNEMLQCPRCRRILTNKNCIKKTYEYCPRCGQHLLWGKRVGRITKL